jgi:glucose-6-phosphate isomerase, archaeal
MIKDYKKTIKEFERHRSKPRRLKDVGKWYKDKDAVEGILRSEGNRVIYETFTDKFSPIDLTLTVVHPGVIGKEFHMTKGHVHRKLTPEFYILLEGKGKLVIQKNEMKVIELKKGEIALIPKGYAHRLVNDGRKDLKVLTIYDQASRPDYHIRFRKRFFRR